MTTPLRISAKSLGSLAMPGFCPRCFWIKTHWGKELPYQIFPGIFSSIDSYGKRIVHQWFDRHGSPPSWLAGLGDIRGYKDPPHHAKFGVLIEEASVMVSGAPDGIFVRADGSFLIIDYKTARFSEYQDRLFPMYDAQLNAYAYIGERCGFSPVTALALVYTEPVTGESAVSEDNHTTSDGFFLNFSAKILPVKITPEKIPALCRLARETYDLVRPPHPRAGCKDCALLAGLIEVASR